LFDEVDGKRLGIYEMLMKATYIFTKSDMQLRRMYQYIVFNSLMGNGDAHLKNFSVQYEENKKELILTPPYDITHTPIYDTIDNKMALKLNGVKLFPDNKQLVKLGKAYNIEKPEAIIEELADTIRGYINSSSEVGLIEGLKDSILRSVHCDISEK